MFQDPRPLVERFGAEFFRRLPPGPGVYLMRDAAATVLYVGKARNLRKRLGSYRVANPDRLPRRHLRLLRAVARIDLELCEDEAAALRREAALLSELRPRFNRAGTWKGPERYLSWQLAEAGLNLAVTPTSPEGWPTFGPMRSAALSLRAALARLLWCATQPEKQMQELPAGWFAGQHEEVATIRRSPGNTMLLMRAAGGLEDLRGGRFAEFSAWINEQTRERRHPFETAALQLDLELVSYCAKRFSG